MRLSTCWTWLHLLLCLVVDNPCLEDLVGRSYVLAMAFIAAFVWPIRTVDAQVLISDEFEGTGLVDQEVWRLPFLGPNAFYGRTEAKTDRSIHYPLMNNGTARLRLDTFRDNGSGQSTGMFHGAELMTKRNFAVVGGLRFNVRCRLVDPVGGLVGAAFMFDVQRENGNGDLIRDEIDFELLSNATNGVLTNFWNEGAFFGKDSGGSPVFLLPDPAFDLTDFQDYRLDWLPGRMEWYVNDELFRTETVDIADDPMNFHMNLWVPDEGFFGAFDEALQPAISLAENEVFEFEIDRVEIERLNTIRSGNLLLDSGFENPAFPFFSLNNGGPIDQSATGRWIAFNNVNFSNAISNSGDRSLVMFGPFSGNSDASGIFQNVDVEPGDVLEASVYCRTNVGDSIAGQANNTTIKLEFLDAAGNLIPGVQPFLGGNGKESVILEGRDPDVPENRWVRREVNALAPENAVRARVSLLFVQLENGPGATFFDDFELVQLSPQNVLLGDVNLDGDVNLLDVAPFVALVVGNDFQAEADINTDGVVNLLDVEPFVSLLAN